MKKFFCSKNINHKSLIVTKYSTQLADLFKFKITMNKLLERKIFHYAILNHSVNELSNLNQLTQKHTKILYDLGKFSNLCLVDQKFVIVNISSLSLGYKEFLDFLKYLHEKSEEDINNIIRDMIENNLEDQEINKYLLQLRDDWRECLNPEILDESLNPIRTSSVISQINLEANKIISKLLI
jgi:hypothetical protein